MQPAIFFNWTIQLVVKTQAVKKLRAKWKKRKEMWKNGESGGGIDKCNVNLVLCGESGFGYW